MPGPGLGAGDAAGEKRSCLVLRELKHLGKDREIKQMVIIVVNIYKALGATSYAKHFKT